MRFGEFGFIALLVGVPVWLVSRAWRRYISLDHLALGDSLQMRVALSFISVSTGMWIVVFALMLLEDHSSRAKSVATNLSPAIFGFINLLLCVGAIVCSRFSRAAAQKSLPLRRAIGLSSGCLMLIWLFLLANPH